MAYIADGLGPFPNKKDEFCGNYDPRSRYCGSSDHVRHIKEWLTRVRFGRPRSCVTGVAKDLEAEGYVGLYYKETQPLGPDETEVETPDELKEPDGPCPQWIIDLDQRK